jgi:flagellin
VRVRYITQASLTQPVAGGITPGSESVTLGTPAAPVPNAGGPGGNGYYYDPVANTVSLVGTARPGATTTGAARAFRTTALPTGNTGLTLDTLTGNTFTTGAVLNSLTVTSSKGGVLAPGQYTLNQTLVAQIGPTQLFQYSISVPNSLLATFGSGPHTLSATYNIDYPNSVVPLDIEMQVGANNGMTQKVTIDPASVGALGLGGANVLLQDDAMLAITAIDKAIAQVSTNRGRVGAAVNQMQGYHNNVTNQAIQMDAAFSHIRDTDMADQMTNLTKQQILANSSTSMLNVSQNSTQYLLSLITA